MKNPRVIKICVSGLLIAIGLIIPIFSPVKVVLEPASFTLASHVPIFIAMFISPVMAVAVALGTTLGFFMGGFPIIIVIRASTHIFFALAGSFLLHKVTKKELSALHLRIFSFYIAVIHALGELIVVSVFYFDGNISQAHLDQGFLTSVLLLVGVGTVIHSMIDFEIARLIILPLKKQKNLAQYIK
ncbi:MAG: hypothetical protein FWD44_07555 [Oscillospiraceae bacterium]|nr:hypothetical protein [Oscillospiraceae bacterium]